MQSAVSATVLPPHCLKEQHRTLFLQAVSRLFSSSTSDLNILNWTEHTSLHSVTFCTPTGTFAHTCTHYTCNVILYLYLYTNLFLALFLHLILYDCFVVCCMYAAMAPRFPSGINNVSLILICYDIVSPSKVVSVMNTQV